MSQLKKNLLANLIGKGWVALMAFAFVPFYIKFLGMEAYGLIGFFVTLQALSSLLDMGLSTTLNREIARLSATQEKAQNIRDLVRTLELVYWIIAAVAVLLVVFLSPLISAHWIRPQNLSQSTIQQATLLMGLAIALQLPSALYSGGLLGLQRQVLLNYIVGGIATVRGLGAVLILWLISPNILVFFGWQILAGISQTVLTSLFLWKSLPASDSKPRFRKSLLLSISGFAADMTGIAVLAILLTQLDKIILSKMLTLETFGYYTLAGLIASGLYIIVTPVFTAVFPRLSQLVSLNDRDGLILLYHRSCQLMSVLIIPTAIISALFAPEILLIWTRNPVIVKATYLLVCLLIIGTAINGLLNVPYALQLAFGWTRFVLYQTLVLVILLVPLIVFATIHYGAIGAAVIWIFLNLGCFIISIQIMHAKLLKHEKSRYYFQDIGLPLLGAMPVAFIGRLLFPDSSSIPMTITYLLAISFLTLLFSALATTTTRHWIKESILSGKLWASEQVVFERRS